MGKIHSLPPDVVGKIAAGEVIERPAYAVKELVENAIDAGSDYIQVHIDDAGLSRITVIDNGEGMDREDLELSFLPHTTSKISDDLHGVKTLGFRGEALSSIAAISNLSIKSRPASSVGGLAISLGLSNKTITPIGMTVGTIVTVDQLFHSVPARKKFLKSAKTEFRHITNTVLQLAVSYPSIHFLLTHNKKEILDLPKKESRTERLHLLFGTSQLEQMLPITHTEGHIQISGHIAKPVFASKQNQKQYLFVNNRPISDASISRAIREAYGTLLPSSSTPVFSLHITVPHETIDVNVHPRKEQISFTNDHYVTDTIRDVVRKSLADHDITFNVSLFKHRTSAKTGETTSFAADLLRETVLPWNRSPIDVSSFPTHIVQVHHTYILNITKEGLSIVDQHAAHERILYEEFVQAFAEERSKRAQYYLPKPIPISIGITEAQLLEEFRSYLDAIGFTIEPFQGDSYIIRAAPLIFKGRKIEPIVRDMLSDLATEGLIQSIDVRTQRMLAFLACRAAVQAGDSLTEEECEKLMSQLDQTPNKATCPHGRPTRTEIPISQLNAWFKRSS